MTATTRSIEAHLNEVAQAAGGRALTGLTIAARVTLAAHALNNEGSRNNATIPRQVDVVTNGGDEVAQTNAVSGDTTKHGFVDYLRACIEDIERQNPDAARALPLCAGCRTANANRLNEDKNFGQQIKGLKGAAAIVDALLAACAIDDVAGLLVTQGNNAAPRRSTIQFGWQIGLPDRTRTQRLTHVKLVPGAPGAESSEGSNLGQNIFTRPASSGVYAFIAQAELHRIGFNDITRRYMVDAETRAARTRVALEALYLSVVAPSGAQRNTQLPHLQSACGAVALSFSALPAVCVSPLTDDFVPSMARIAGAFNRGGRDQFVLPFGDAADLGELLTGISALKLA